MMIRTHHSKYNDKGKERSSEGTCHIFLDLKIWKVPLISNNISIEELCIKKCSYTPPIASYLIQKYAKHHKFQNMPTLTNFGPKGALTVPE